MKKKNKRRITLIQKKYSDGLTQEEIVELEKLEQEMSVYMEEHFPRSSEILDEMAERLAQLKEKIIEKRRNKCK